MIPKERQRGFYGQLRRQSRGIRRELGRQKGIGLSEGSNSRLRVRARKMGVGAREFLRFAPLERGVLLRVSL